MLVLSRKVGESIEIGNSVVTVLDVKGDKISLGIQAPTEVPVYRGEVADRMRAEGSPIVSGAKPQAEPTTSG